MEASESGMDECDSIFPLRRFQAPPDSQARRREGLLGPRVWPRPGPRAMLIFIRRIFFSGAPP